MRFAVPWIRLGTRGGAERRRGVSESGSVGHVPRAHHAVLTANLPFGLKRVARTALKRNARAVTPTGGARAEGKRKDGWRKETCLECDADYTEGLDSSKPR